MADAVEVTDNLDDVIEGYINALVASINFNMAGEQKALGEELVDIAAIGMAERASIAEDADGNQWNENEPKYAAWKNRHYRVGAFAPNRRTGQMTSFESLRGQVEIGDDEIVMKYGTGQTPTRTATGAALLSGDQKATDREKAGYCQPARPFYGMDEDIANDALERTSDSIDRMIEAF